ncbi:MAG TPA: nitroreductase family protein [Ramlibacter sp.]|uniref:nitroreductase family protein n=1 Tax=Ramlibacter sp. TaxID=1917967 RepID=UPI002D7E9824|nr:nitroreductase family protein [Ramlibacter sp.]HET8746710.1 nitroreductase family protein [Ramlibacter sp.]
MAHMPSDPLMDAVPLPTPRLQGNLTLEAALKKRHSTRDYLPDALTLEQVSALLWAGFGVNRPGSWGRTAPTTCDTQEIVLYAVTQEGAWRYDARDHRLLRVRSGDLRALTGTQDFVSVAPLNLVYVIDHARLTAGDAMDPEEHGVLAGADVGCIVENIYLYCAGAGLATVVRGQIDRPALAAALGLNAQQRIALAQSVGLARPTAH